MPTNDPTDLIAELRGQLGDARVVVDEDQRELMSGDFYSQGVTCAAVIRPADTGMLANAVRIVTAAGYALIPRGGGMTYTGGYTPENAACVVVDLDDLQGIVDFDAQNMTVTARAGTTWETLYDALAPHGLRLPFFGTFSGRRATVGGGLSNGAVFFGTARYGTAADQVLGIEVVCADGRVLRTGQAAFRNGKPFYRTHGPDLTGPFLHDGGALGIKTEATFRLIEKPRHTDFLSYAFPNALAAATALSYIGRSGAAEEAYVFDPEATSRNMQGSTLSGDLRRLGDIVTGQRNILAGLLAGMRVILSGKRLVPEGAYSLHLVCAGRSREAVNGDLALCRQLLDRNGGTEIPNSIPLAVRAAPFDGLNGVLGPSGERWLALNAKVPHSDFGTIIERFDELLAKYRARIVEAQVVVSTLFIAMDTHAVSFETVFNWPDKWLPMHRAVPDPAHLERLTEPDANPAAAELVAELRRETLALFDELGAASNQIGRTYQFVEKLEPATVALVDALKAELDPDCRMNPGVLGLRPKSRRQN
jgi:FAD/FMN-containing dehydrogenase